MATVIDSLVVTLGLDPKQFKAGVKAADDGHKKIEAGAKKANSEIERTGKKAAEAIGALRNEVLRMAAVFVGFSAIKSFIESVTRSDIALGRMAKGMDASVGSLSLWKAVAEQAGVSGDALVGDLANLSEGLQRFSLTGEGGDFIRYFRAVGVALTDAKGKMRPFEEVLEDLASRFEGMDPAKARALGHGMGLSSDTIDLLLKGRKALDGYLASAKKNALSDDDVKAAQERNKAWQELSQTFARLGRDVLNELTPALVGLLSFIKEHATGAAVVMGSLALAMSAVAAVRFGGMLGEIAQLGGLLAGTAGKAGLLISMLGRLGLLGAVGGAAFGITRMISEATGLDDVMSRFGSWLYDKLNPSAGTFPDAVRGKSARVPGSSLPRGIRNNNPGNLEFRGQAGAHPEAGSGRFAAWGSMAEGVSALASQLQRYGSQGVDTISAIISKYAPAGENNTGAYIASLAKSMGLSADQHLNLNDPNILRGLIGGISTVENGVGMLSAAQINAGMDLFRGRRGGGSSEVHIGELNVHTRATDANGIARDLPSALQNQDFAIQANSGLF